MLFVEDALRGLELEASFCHKRLEASQGLLECCWRA